MKEYAEFFKYHGIWSESEERLKSYLAVGQAVILWRGWVMGTRRCHFGLSQNR